MHAEQARLVAIEMSRPDSLSDAVSGQVHFRDNSPRIPADQSTQCMRRASGGGGGDCTTKTTVVHVNVVCVGVWPERPVCIYEGMSGCGLHIAAYS